MKSSENCALLHESKGTDVVSHAQEVVAGCSRRLQIQERLTAEVARTLEVIMGAEGLVVVCQAAHMCMVARGVQQLASTTVTLSARGSLEQPSLMRSQLLGRLMTVTV